MFDYTGGINTQFCFSFHSSGSKLWLETGNRGVEQFARRNHQKRASIRESSEKKNSLKNTQKDTRPARVGEHTGQAGELRMIILQDNENRFTPATALSPPLLSRSTRALLQSTSVRVGYANWAHATRAGLGENRGPHFGRANS